MASGGLSGTAVGLVTAGGVLLWAGISNRTPADVLRGTLGRPTSGRTIGTPLGEIQSGITRPTPGSAGTPTTIGQRTGKLVAEARRQLGKPYVWAATGPDTFDCSGLVVWCVRRAGWPRAPRFTTYTFGAWAKGAQWRRVKPSEFRSGDVVLRSGHMGIATGNDTMIHAPHPGTVVQEAAIFGTRSAWWGWRPVESFNFPAPEGG